MTEHHTPRIACSTGAISRWPDATGFDRILRWCPQVDADAFEIMLYDAWYPELETVTHQLLQTDFTIVTVHADKDIPNALLHDRATALDLWETNCAFAAALGAPAVVLHMWGYPVSDHQIETQIGAVPDLVQIADAHGVSLAVESIPCLDRTPLEHLRRIVGLDNRIQVTLDTEFLAIHRQLQSALDADWLWRDQRVVQVHIKDFDGEGWGANGSRRYLHPGEGSIPFMDWIPALRSRGYHGPLTLESPVVDPDGGIDIPRLNTSLSRLRHFDALSTFKI